MPKLRRRTSKNAANTKFIKTEPVSGSAADFGTIKEVEQSDTNHASKMLIKLEQNLLQISLKLPQSIANKTLKELKTLPLNSLPEFKTTTINSTVRSTSRRLGVSRSSSVESFASVSPNKSNMKSRARVSRSVSRTRTAAINNNIVTPSCSAKSLNSVGLITPKIKPNAPQVILRRPKQGEVAVSMQGSPLMVGGVVTDDTANVNIPLNDGRVLSIQPEKGLQITGLPNFDKHTQRQVETLLDNLSKVCKMFKK